MSEEVSTTPLDLTEATRQLNEAFDTSDVPAICRSFGELAGLFNVAELARVAGVERTSLYRTFRGAQSPNVSTLVALLDAMNLQMKVIPRKVKRRKSRAVLPPPEK
jgi:probable addiction module antidote protein